MTTTIDNIIMDISSTIDTGFPDTKPELLQPYWRVRGME